MGTIHVARAGATRGTFSLEEVREGLRTGKFLPSDLGWQTGMADWRPLSEIAAEPAAGTSQPGTPQPTAQPARIIPASAYSSPDVHSGLPWEHRQELGLFKAFFDTVILVLSKPTEAFKTMRPEGGLTDPLLFALIGGSIGLVISVIFQVLFTSLSFWGGQEGAALGMGFVLLYLIMIPVFIVAGMFIASGVLHLCLLMVGGASKPFETTFRIVCFSCGSTYLIALVPFCGNYVSFIYNIVVEIMGVASAHETTTGKAVMAVLLPIILCCGGALAFAIFVMGGIGALSQFGR